MTAVVRDVNEDCPGEMQVESNRASQDFGKVRETLVELVRIHEESWHGLKILANSSA